MAWLNLSEHLKEDEIPNPVEFVKQCEKITEYVIFARACPRSHSPRGTFRILQIHEDKEAFETASESEANSGLEKDVCCVMVFE